MAVLRSVRWVGSSLRDVRALPEDAKRSIGFVLSRAQEGKPHPSIKPLTGLPGVSEIVANVDGDTYRLVYVVNLPEALYVLHAFKKKSTRGTATPKKDTSVIRARLRQAQEASREHQR